LAGYKLYESIGRCCSTNLSIECTNCNLNGTNCTQCQTGYYLNITGVCSICSTIDPNCV
jgi:hypothetical protein